MPRCGRAALVHPEGPLEGYRGAAGVVRAPAAHPGNRKYEDDDRTEEADSFAALRNDKQKDRHPGGNRKGIARPGKAGAPGVTVRTSRSSSGRFKYKNGKPPSDRSEID